MRLAVSAVQRNTASKRWIDPPDLSPDDLPGWQKVEPLAGRRVGREIRERPKPNLDPLANRKALGDSRDDDGAGTDLDVFELGVLRHQDQVWLDGELSNDLCVRQPPPAHRDDVLAFESACDQAAVELEREVLVEQEPQEASLTAGGVWAARCAAYRSAAMTCSRVSW